MNRTQDTKSGNGLAYGLIAMGVAARLLPHPPNVTPLTALALFGGTVLSAPWGIAVPLASVMLSDLVIGLHEVVAFTWGGFAVTGLLGWWIRQRPSGSRIVIAAGLGATVFFLMTNLGVWLVGDGGMMYPKTLDGLWRCYVAALPFYRNSLIGDLGYTLGVFGVHAWLTKRRALCLAQRTGNALSRQAH